MSPSGAPSAGSGCGGCGCGCGGGGGGAMPSAARKTERTRSIGPLVARIASKSARSCDAISAGGSIASTWRIAARIEALHVKREGQGGGGHARVERHCAHRGAA
eukprot:270422-Chlamydomonas_euryale.AAC.1